MAIECSHGRLARKCEHCELEEALARIKALEDVVRELVDGGKLLKVTSMPGAENGLAWARWEHIEKKAFELLNGGK